MIGHLFRVAASLESLVLGEGQILGQVREAYRAADERNTVGPILHTVFQNALRVGKKVREDTGMDQGKLSVASVAVDVAREMFDTFADKTVLVIGAGKMGDLTFSISRRCIPAASSSPTATPSAPRPPRRTGAARPCPSTPDLALIEADVVVSTTAADRAGRDLRPVRPRSARPQEPARLDPRHRHPARLRPQDRRTRPSHASTTSMTCVPRPRRTSAAAEGVDPALAIIEREATACYTASAITATPAPSFASSATTGTRSASASKIVLFSVTAPT